jgi:glycerol kinase
MLARCASAAGRPFARTARAIGSTRANTTSTAKYIAVVDEGTTSTRTVLFNRQGGSAFASQLEFTQIMPKQGLVEHDPLEILDKTRTTMDDVMNKAGASASDVACLGITNQRETTVVWDRHTGQPLHNAIVWMDTRASGICDAVSAAQGGVDSLRARTGLPVNAYFSGPKIRWLLDNVDSVRRAAERGDALFGTIDTWLLWNFTGGAASSSSGGAQARPVHATDVSNASRTLLMNLDTLDWDDSLLAAFGVPRSMLPVVAPSASATSFGRVALGGGRGSALNGVPITGILGDQQAALFGQACFQAGMAKCTYGTGAFALKNTGPTKKLSDNGLLTTVAYQLEGQPAAYALEGSVAIAGAVVQWLRDNLEIITSSKDVDPLVQSVEDNGGVYFVPAFSGLYAPRWRPDARGCIVGLTRFVRKGHLMRAALESIAFQTRDVLAAMSSDSGSPLRSLQVDGGATVNEVLMQFQSDVLGAPVTKPRDATNTTAQGAAFVAGLGQGVYASLEEVAGLVTSDRTWHPTMEEQRRAEHLRQWDKAIARSLDWVEP